VSSPRDLPPLAGELVEDVLDGTMFVKRETTASLYHELIRLHRRRGEASASKMRADFRWSVYLPRAKR
jgi:hypothetical protein